MPSPVDKAARSRKGTYHTMTDHRMLDQNVYEAALSRMHRIYEQFDTVKVMFSGGKDSMAAMEVAITVARERGVLPVTVIFYDEEVIPYETEDYVRRTAARPEVDLLWYCIPTRQRNSTTDETWWYEWAPEDEPLWVRPLPPEALTSLDGFIIDPPEKRLAIPEMNGLHFTPDDGRGAVVMGIRAGESLVRMQAVSRREVDNYIIHLNKDSTPCLRSPVAKVYPVYDWVDADVWTGANEFGWDYNTAYDVMEMAGITRSSQRLAAPYAEDSMRCLDVYRECFPAIYERALYRVPGVTVAARYANTQLYSFNGVPPKPEGLTWKEHVAHLVAHFGDDSRARAAFMVAKLIKYHCNRTIDPIMPTARHPDSGVSWEEIAKRAARGDFKERRQAPLTRDPKVMAKRWLEYDAERQELERLAGRRLTGTETGDVL